MADLEGPDELIGLVRAAAVVGVPFATLRADAYRGRLKATRQGRDWYTTRRWLHRYLRQPATTAWRPSGHPRFLPADYQTPEGEEPIP